MSTSTWRFELKGSDGATHIFDSWVMIAEGHRSFPRTTASP